MASFVACATCGEDNRKDAKFCSKCGKPLPLIGRYAILRLVGDGGFGTVYKAEDTFSNQVVAIKKMNQTGLSQREMVKAEADFRREARMLANLDHPNLPHIRNYFLDDGHWYLVMDFVEGETLEAQLDKRSGKGLPLEDALIIGTQLSRVLDYLHTQQPPIIFRDLNPANIMLTPKKHIYLIDFGIARHFQPGWLYTDALGKAGYAAPEQYKPSAPATLLSDVYGLGATLHQLLSGRHPLSGIPNLFHFPPLKSFIPSIPTEIEALIMRMVEIDIRKRPASMAEIKEKLALIYSDVLATTPTLPLAPSPQAKAAPPAPAQVPIPQAAPNIVQKSVQAPQPAVKKQPVQSPSPVVISPTVGTILSNYDIPSKQNNSTMWIGAVDLSPDWTRIALVRGDISTYSASVVNVRLEGIKLATQEILYTNKVIYLNNYTNNITWSPDGKYIAVGGRYHSNEGIVIVDATSGSEVLGYIQHGSNYYGLKGKVQCIAWSPDGTHIASGSSGKVLIWEAITGKDILIYRKCPDPYGVAWSPDGTHIASWRWDVHRDKKDDLYYDGSVLVWNIQTGTTLCEYHKSSKAVYILAWSPDGKHIASAGIDDSTVEVWEATTGTLLLTYTGHSNRVWYLAWSPDGKHIASGSSDKTAHIWDVATGKHIYTHHGYVSAPKVVWSQDGKSIAAMDWSKVQIWQAV